MSPDITMCDGVDCPIKETCYRFKAKATPYRQSFAHFEYDKEKKDCEYFMEIWKKP